MSIYKCYIFLKKYKCYIFISLSKILHHVFHCCATMHILLITPCMEVGTNQVSDAGGQFICCAGHLLSYVGKLKKKAPVSPPAQHMRSFSAGMCVQLQGSARAPLAVNWGSANAALIGVQRARPAPDPGGEIRGATRSRGAIGRPGLSPCAQRLLPSPRGVARQLALARGRGAQRAARRQGGAWPPFQA